MTAAVVVVAMVAVVMVEGAVAMATVAMVVGAVSTVTSDGTAPVNASVGEVR